MNKFKVNDIFYFFIHSGIQDMQHSCITDIYTEWTFMI